MAIDSPPPRVSTTRLADPGRGPAIVALLVVAFLAAGMGSSLLTGAADPARRSDGLAAQRDPRGSIVALAAPSATPSTAEPPAPTSEPSLGPGEISCLPAGWRLAYVGSVGVWRMETWLAVEPAPATGPLDVTIPIAQLGRDVISGLGACAPPVGTTSGGRAAVIEHAWRVVRSSGADTALPIGLLTLAETPSAARPLRADALALVRPAGAGASWEAGDYVLELALPGSGGRAPAAGPSSWLHIQLESPTP